MAMRFRTSCSFQKRLRLRHRKGTTAVEMALLAPVFFMMLIGLTEISLVIAAQQLLESASFNASRLAKTGYVNGTLTQDQTVDEVLNNQLSSFGTLIDTSRIVTTQEAYTNFSAIGAGGGVGGYGTAQQIIVYTVTYPWKLFTPMMGHLIGTWDTNSSSFVLNLSTRIVVRNEPY
ncbi:MAG: TadE/TadG family type IV pilus assembly protein [Alphaproteobacteria bacterium]